MKRLAEKKFGLPPVTQAPAMKVSDVLRLLPIYRSFPIKSRKRASYCARRCVSQAIEYSIVRQRQCSFLGLRFLVVSEAATHHRLQRVERGLAAEIDGISH